MTSDSTPAETKCGKKKSRTAMGVKMAAENIRKIGPTMRPWVY